MGKSSEHGENEITEQARREATRTGQNPCDLLRSWRAEAEQARDKERVRKIIQAEKFLRCRNRRKRG